MLITNLLAQIAFGLIAMTICLPSMQEWGALFGASQAQVPLTFSGFVVAFGVFQLVYGPLSDRYGRKGVLVTGLALMALGSLLAALAPNLEVLIAARVIQGAGSAAGTVVGRAMVQDKFEGPQRTKVMAYIGMAMGLSPPLAAIVGGQLHVRVGWQANFILVMVVALLMLGLALIGMDAPLAFTLPLMLLGAGHGFLMPPTLAGNVGVVPALAGSAAALAGLMQQLMGAVGAYSVGLVPHPGSRNLGWLMLGFTLCALGAHLALRRQRL